MRPEPQMPMGGVLPMVVRRGVVVDAEPSAPPRALTLTLSRPAGEGIFPLASGISLLVDNPRSTRPPRASPAISLRSSASPSLREGEGMVTRSTAPS